MRASFAKLMGILKKPTPLHRAKPPPPPPPPPLIRPSFRPAQSTKDNDLDWIQLADGSLRSVQRRKVHGVLSRPPPALVEASAVRPRFDFRSTLTPEQLSLINGVPKSVLTHGAGPNGYGAIGGFGYISASKAMDMAKTNHHVMVPNWGTSVVVAQAPSAPSAYITASAAAEAPPPPPPRRTEAEMPVLFDNSDMYRPWVPSSGPILTGRDLEREKERAAKRRQFLSSLGPRHPLRGLSG